MKLKESETSIFVVFTYESILFVTHVFLFVHSYQNPVLQKHRDSFPLLLVTNFSLFHYLISLKPVSFVAKQHSSLPGFYRSIHVFCIWVIYLFLSWYPNLYCAKSILSVCNLTHVNCKPLQKNKLVTHFKLR